MARRAPSDEPLPIWETRARKIIRFCVGNGTYLLIASGASEVAGLVPRGPAHPARALFTARPGLTLSETVGSPTTSRGHRSQNCAPRKIRTSDTWFRRPVLYPAELWAPSWRGRDHTRARASVNGLSNKRARLVRGRLPDLRERLPDGHRGIGDRAANIAEWALDRDSHAVPWRTASYRRSAKPRAAIAQVGVLCKRARMARPLL